MIKINSALMVAITTAFRASFAKVLGQAPSKYLLVATSVPSTTASNSYPWLGSMPSMREWLGDRVINGIKAHGYMITNKSFELTVGVPREAIEDDQFGVFTPLIEELGRAAGAHPDQLTFQALSNGTTGLCYDGQNFFDTDHPVIGADGIEASQSNLDASGAGAPWYLLDTSRSLKPMVFQERKKPEFVAKTALTDDNVFNAKEFVYGVDYRGNVGYGLWQLAYRSNQALDEANFAAVWAAMAERKGDYGRPLGIAPDVLLVPPSLFVQAQKVVSADKLANGADNVLKGIVRVEMVPWL